MQTCPSWGALSLRLRLPAATIKLSGLSLAQRDSLRDIYQGFLISSDAETDGYALECRACRLDHPVDISLEDLLQDGQYSPRIRHSPEKNGIDLTGINFEAQIRSENGAAYSTLGVLYEHEFPYGNVIESFLRVFIARRVLEQGGVMLHSAGLVFNEKAFIFTGRSNAGKTTLTRKAYRDGARVLSDDINVLMPGENQFLACAVPFTGEFGRTLEHPGGNESFPVEAIVLLEQGRKLATEQVRPSTAVAGLLTGCPFVNTDDALSAQLFDVVTEVTNQVPVIRLISRRDDPVEQIMNAVLNTLAI